MSEWRRQRFPARCGYCGTPIALGAPVLVLTLGRREKRRCAQCAGSPVPPDLPAIVVERQVPALLPMMRLTAGMLPLDFKQRQAEREPGEDG